MTNLTAAAVPGAAVPTLRVSFTTPPPDNAAPLPEVRVRVLAGPVGDIVASVVVTGLFGAASATYTRDLTGPAMVFSTLYTVEATSRSAWGEAKVTTTGTTGDDPVIPTPDTPVLTAVGGIGTIAMTWTHSGTNVTGWEVRIGAAAWVVLTNSALRAYTFTALADDFTATVSVRAVNGSVQGTAASATATTRRAASPLLPASPVVTATPGVTSAAVTWTWTGSGEVTGWERKLDSGPWVRVTGGAAARATNISRLTAETAYTVRIRGVNDIGEGVAGQDDFTTLKDVVVAAPTIASAPTLVAQNGEVDAMFVLTSNGGSAITRYDWQREDAGTPGVWRLFRPVSLGASLGFEDSTVVNGTRYRYRVRATNTTGTGTSPWSEYVTPEDDATVPDRISVVQAEATGTSGEVVLRAAPARASADAPVTKNQYRYTTDGGAAWSAWADATGVPPDFGVHEHTVTGLGDGFAYQFQVRGVNRIGEAPASDPTQPVFPSYRGGISTAPDPALPIERDETPAAAPARPAFVAVGRSTFNPSRIDFSIRWTCVMPSPFFEQTIFAWQYAPVDKAGVIGSPVTMPVTRGATGVFFNQPVGSVPNEDRSALPFRRRVVCRIRTSSGVSPWSPVSPFVEVTDGAHPDAPPAPDKPTVRPADRALYVDWASNGDGNSPITKWQVRWRIKGAAAWGAWMDAAGRTQGEGVGTTRIDGLTNGQDYEVQVRAVNAIRNGAASPASD